MLGGVGVVAGSEGHHGHVVVVVVGVSEVELVSCVGVDHFLFFIK